MTVNTANRLNNMPEPVKMKRRSNENEEKSKTLPNKASSSSSGNAHERVGSADLAHLIADQAAAHANAREGGKSHSRAHSTTDDVFQDEWRYEYDADNGEKVWIQILRRVFTDKRGW